MKYFNSFTSNRLWTCHRGGLLWLLFALPVSWLGAQQTGNAPAPGDYTLRIVESWNQDTTQYATDTEPLNITKRRYDRLLRRQQRDKYEGRWLVSGSLSMGFSRSGYYGGATYTRTTKENSYTRFYPSFGEVIYADYDEGSYGEDITSYSSLFPRVGVARQTRWGGYFYAAPGLYRNRVSLNGDPYANLDEDQIRTVKTLSKDMGTFEAGFQYTFMRRHRFQPYLGFSVLSILYYDRAIRSNFYEAKTRQSGSVDRFYQEPFFIPAPELMLTTGFQFAVNERISVGAHVVVDRGFRDFIDAPVGIEIRHSLK
ncbi:hypothetical protein [Neolewinella antarctica]|uniref:Uncharacterized protein n=1 Tax=Neolewinella antarctica TaxID=442734 RepID=A0ABX0XBU7_9BACT|nr:hypothetical protein [Neolewinella antarctica]NJC26740.1 hypothetical protein [Neolewinella antarctica]